MGSHSAVQCVMCLMGQPLCCSAADSGVWGERGYGDASTPLRVTQQYRLASMAALLSSSGSSHHNLLTPQSLSPQSTAALVLGLLHNPETPAPSSCTFQGTCVHVWGMYVCGKDCLILIPFRLPHISYFTLSLRCFFSDSDNCPMWGWDPCFSFPTR